ncbi:hypothetical protein [Sulfurimonas sp.]|uniref:hypothetical protein n=1 Tax=Sulfurimonas sp. TaxID=2022749 RepID=UPI0035614B42
MSVEFISYVDEDSSGNWFIELTDTLADKTVVCINMAEYKKSIEELGAEYGNDIMVKWTKSKTLSPKSYEELNQEMMKLQIEYEDEINQINNQNQYSQENPGFNPNA